MPRRRFFVSPESIQRGIARLSPEETHHLRNVLRIRPGQTVEVIDGEGNCYLGKVDREGENLVVASLKPLADNPDFFPSVIVLAIALIRPQRFEWALEKCAELGAAEIVPVISRFCEVKIPPERIAEKRRRWERIVRESSKQSRRARVPEVARPIRIGEFLNSEAGQGGTRIFFWEKSSELWDGMPADSSRIALCVGPEGGWHAEEVRAAGDAGWSVFGLGPGILRTETAAIAALAVCRHRAAMSYWSP